MALRREAIAAAGPFDEELGAGARFHAAEDTEMLYRVMRAGWGVVCAPDLIVTHQAWRSGRDWLRLQYRYGIGLGAQTAKHARAGERHAVRMGVGIGLRLPPRDRMRPSYALGRLLLSTGMAVGFVRWRRDHRAKNAADAALPPRER
jgi:GT2 family glycosyltransferase